MTTSDVYEKENLLRELRLLMSRKPPENSPPSVEDDFHLKSHELYFELLSRYPSFAVDNKLELEMWNNLYKVPIDNLQGALHQRNAVSTVSGQPRSVMELKLRSVLLLDRASGVYLTLIHRLLQSLHDSSWPKSILGKISSPASPNGLFQLNRLGRTTGRFDLDLSTFSALQKFIKLNYTGPIWFRRWNVGDGNESSSSTTTTAPRILSRGDRLPQDSDTQPNQSTELTSTDLANQHNESETSSSNAVDSNSSAAGLPPPAPPAPRIDHALAVTYIVQHCLVHLGDVARYRQQSNVAAGYYLWAWAVHPDSGHPYNQLAILESAKPAPNRHLEALFYYYVRAIACLYPFPAARSNLKGMLRTHMGALHAAATRQIETNTHTTDSTPRDPRHLLLFLYAAFHLGIDPVRLVSFTKEFANAVASGPQIRLNEQWTWHLVTIHIFLLNEHLTNNNPAPADSEQTVKLPEQTGLNKQDLTTVLLVHLMVNLLDWLARDYLALNERSESADVHTCRTLLSGILLFLMWLRKQASSDSRLTWSFSNYAPVFSERVVLLLNVAAAQAHSAADPSKTQNLESESSRVSVENEKCNWTSVPWPELIHLPELAILQGFQPLDVPTQRQLDLTEPMQLRCPLRISPQFLHSQSTTVAAPHLDADEIEFSTSTSLSDQSRLRLKFLIQSARVVAQAFPTLVKWNCASITEAEPGPSMPLGHFVAVCTPKSDLTDMVPKISSVRRNPDVPSNSPLNALIPNKVQVETCDATELEPSLTSKEPKRTSSTQSMDRSEMTKATTSATNEAVPCNDEHKSSIVEDSKTDSRDRSSTDDKPESVTVPVALPTSVAESEPELANNQGNTSGAATTVSGGLIVNAELAKFIQEQASQVAARQQRVGFSTAAEFHSGKPINHDGLHKSSSTGTFRSSGSKGASSRLCLSAAFRRDLPPRFAKRLQAELLEREAQEARQMALDSNSIGATASDLASLSLDQPAPLARKESEAPYDLNSLLSATDTMGMNGIPLLSEDFIGGHSHFTTDSPRDRISNMADASQGTALPSYNAPLIHPSFSVPSMLPPLSAPMPFLNNDQSFHPSRPMFGAPVTVPSCVRPMFDWPVNQVGPSSMRSAHLDDYVPNSTLGLSRFPTPLTTSPGHYSRPVHPLADLRLPPGAPVPGAMTTVHEEDQARHADFMPVRSIGVPPLMDNPTGFQAPGSHEGRINTYHHPLPQHTYTETDQSAINNYTAVP